MVGTAVEQLPQSEWIPAEPGPWTPDIPSPTNRGLTFGLNIVPKSNGLYGPERAQVVEVPQDVSLFAGASKSCHGQLHSVPAVSGGDVRFYTGTFAPGAGNSRILSRTENGVWEDLSRVGNYEVISTGPWSFANFGNRVIAGNIITRTQLSEGGSAPFADIEDAPLFSSIATVAGFLMGVRANDQVFGEAVQPFRVWWSAIGNAANFPDPTSDEAINVQSGFQDLFGGGPLNRVIPGIGGADAVIVSDRKMWRCNYVGPPQIFQFDEIEADQGTAIPTSIAPYNETFFFFGLNDFYWFDGQNARPIGQGRITEFFENDIDFVAAFGLQSAVAATIDTVNKNYVVSYRSGAAPGNNNDRFLRYNWVTDTWSNGVQTVDGLGNLDSERSATDSPRMHGISPAGQIVVFTGATLEAILQITEGFSRDMSVTEIRNLVPWIDTNEIVALMLVRDQLSQTPVATTERGFSQQGVIPFDIENVNGRYYACRMRIPAGAVWTNYQGAMYEAARHSYGTRSGQGGV